MSAGRGQPTGTRLNARKWYSYKLFLLILPFMALVFLFSYFPLHGWAYAFFDYRPPFQLKDCEFVGFKWFVSLISNASKRKQIVQVLINTFAMSGLGILFSWLPMAFAILLSEIKNAVYKKTVQTITTLPHFISWVLVYSLAFSLLASSGAVNRFIHPEPPAGAGCRTAADASHFPALHGAPAAQKSFPGVWL